MWRGFFHYCYCLHGYSFYRIFGKYREVSQNRQCDIYKVKLKCKVEALMGAILYNFFFPSWFFKRKWLEPSCALCFKDFCHCIVGFLPPKHYHIYFAPILDSEKWCIAHFFCKISWQYMDVSFLPNHIPSRSSNFNLSCFHVFTHAHCHLFLNLYLRCWMGPKWKKPSLFLNDEKIMSIQVNKLLSKSSILRALGFWGA